jgi:hypothetical protein
LRKSNNYACLLVNDDDFGTSIFSDLDNDREESFTDAVNATLNNEESEHPPAATLHRLLAILIHNSIFPTHLMTLGPRGILMTV